MGVRDLGQVGMSIAIWRRAYGCGGFQSWGYWKGRSGTNGERPKTPDKSLDFVLYAEGVAKDFSAQEMME